MKHEHPYAARLIWDGNLGEGTASYAAYGRQYRVQVAGKPDLPGSADPVFRGDSGRHNPEDLYLGAIAACHLLSYLALCARRGLKVLAYEDSADGLLRLERDGSGRFVAITLRPHVRIAAGESAELARTLHEEAHRQCFLAASTATPIEVLPEIEIGA